MITRALFGMTDDNRPVWMHTLSDGRGMEADLISLGAAVVSIRVPDRRGVFTDVALGYDTVAAYVKNPCYMGSIAGRYANRIRNGQFTLDGKEYILDRNIGNHHLHGGGPGFSHQLWKPDVDEQTNELIYRLVSPAGQGGYPGTVKIEVRYRLTEGRLEIAFLAGTDAPTVINLTNHTYFNLAGRGDILGHLLSLNADSFTPVDEAVIPTGEIRSVAGTPFDFRTPHEIRERIDLQEDQLVKGGGYDHNWIINRSGDGLVPAARLYEPGSGRVLEVSTTEPGIQFYAGNFIDPEPAGKGGVRYGLRSGLCLETQHFPDSPNHPHFPSTVLRPENEFQSRTVFRFSTADYDGAFVPAS